ncbi:methyltransferase [Actinomadura rubrobrunea]|uniref:Methyltransferase n=1 Tax=Actinomadura rubrobrunea TaxID=115335 RepID=A0A9W6PVU8_9ACTN|nr:methyltransferase [Actinomadura rubrobrunea]GLW63936.1 methyltransferase [Actinomadura rubrobrunea]
MSPDHASEQVRQLNRIVFRPWEPQIIATFVRFEMAERLAAGPRTTDDLAAELGAHADSLGRFLRSCAVLDLLETSDGTTFSVTELGRLLCSHEAGMRNIVMMNFTPGIWNRAGRLYETVLTGKPVLDDNGEDLYDYYRHSPDERAWHAAAMADLAGDAGAAIAEHYDLGPVSTVVDVGGSLGVLLSRLLEKTPGVTGTVFDLPDIVAKGREWAAGTGVADRLSFVGGSFFEDVPPRADLYLLKQVLCDWGDEDAARILDSVFRGAPSGSRLVVIEWMRPDDAMPSEFDSMSLGLQAVTGGRVRTEREFVGLLEGAGFKFESTVTVPSLLLPRPWHLLQAVRP